jgi:beta-galactosidase/beta-glucuronidase
MTFSNRNEYPEPQFQREIWKNLNGEWEFEFDDQRVGNKEKWFLSEKSFTKRIQVPFVYQSELSGIGITEFHDLVWYRKKITIPTSFSDKKIILHFGAVDYLTDIWVNGQHKISHQGGNTPFKADITNEVVQGENVIVVRVEDFSTDKTLPRGKQYWKEKSEAIWYTNTTGIWQTVWLEAVSDISIEKIKFTPFIDTTEIEIQSFINGYKNLGNIQLQISIYFDGEVVIQDIYGVKSNVETRRIRLNEFNEHHVSHLWTPETPFLYDVELKIICDGVVLDKVKSYFGMRKISVENGKVCLNNRPYYMKLVLDQGYFPKGILTAPSDEALRKDIEMTKALGFNGVRKHQKVEDPRYLYWCDKLGLIVWGEMANALDYSEDYVKKISGEWQEVIERDYNHPCILVWVPLNESWGVPKILTDSKQQQHALAMYHLTKSLDSTRLVVSNDGWELVKTDLCTVHDYEWRSEILGKRYKTVENAIGEMPAGRQIFVGEYQYCGQPIVVSEFGGIAYKNVEENGWGYSGAESEEDFLNRFQSVVGSLKGSDTIQGFCYTQLTDVEQEMNGLLSSGRVPKVPIEEICKIIKS